MSIITKWDCYCFSVFFKDQTKMVFLYQKIYHLSQEKDIVNIDWNRAS